MEKNNLKINTKCVHSGTYFDNKSYGINTPIFASTAHIYPNAQDLVRYPRHYNIINQSAVADKICALEGGDAGLMFSSGMAAISTTLFALLKEGDHALFQSGLYGGTQHFIESELERYNLQKDVIGSNNVDDYAEAIKKNTILIYVETPTNPLLDIIDLQKIAHIGKEHNIITIVDNTFATPINQNPLQLGFDIVIHSGTKYLNGHSDVSCGAVVTSMELMGKIKYCAENHGGVLDTFACYLLERGLKTLGLRVKQQNSNAQRLAEFLNEHPMVKTVYYPGLTTHPGHDTATKQMRGFGGMVSFELACDAETVQKFTTNLKVITSAVSLGGVESILCFPAKTSHSYLTPEEQQKQGITESLIRLSVGIEDCEDLIDDLQSALDNIG